jgi:hypothetical protein
MRAILTMLVLLALTIGSSGTPSLANEAATQDSVAGHYYLQGVMETGSELRLTLDGRFQWYLVYGALDLFAEGTWRKEGGTVRLKSEKTKDVPKPGFKTLTLTIDGADLVPPDGRGAYVRGDPNAPIAFEE